jgi:dihydrofolate synthase/folylpolyglutamate synthase
MTLQLSFADAWAELLSRKPQRMVPDLDRITLLSELMGRPDQAMPAIQVTGTNGKTSAAAALTVLLDALGLRVGTYTSPHLQSVRERVRLNGVPVTEEQFAERYSEIAPYLAEVDQRSSHHVTFFEALTALAYAEFADAPVDVAVYEVGMGGQWDATNLVRGEVALLTRIGLDHRELGGDVEQVAREKAGVIKPGAVVVSAEQPEPVTEILERTASEQDARLVVLGRDVRVHERRPAVGGQLVTVETVTTELEELLVPLHGRHQADNVLCALAAVEGFLGFAGGLDEDLLREAVAGVRVPGRLEVVGRGAERAPVVLDAAHNPGGAGALARALQDEFAHRRRAFVVGVLDDKDVEGVVAALAPLADHLIAVEPPSPRAAAADRVAKAAEGSAADVRIASDVGGGVEMASTLVGHGDAVVVTGSLYTVGAARSALDLDPV